MVSTIVMWLVLVLVASCGTSPTAPASPDVLGTWKGTIADESGISGTASISLTSQNAQGVAGTFTIASGATSLSIDGVASGTTVGPVLTLFLVPSSPLVCSPTLTLSGSISLSMTLANGRLTGRYSGVTCGSARSGTLDLSK